MAEIKNTIGNTELLKLNKIAFLCSRSLPAAAVIPCYDWAIAMREAGRCVVSGFHSQIEKDVFHYLFKGSQPIIVVLARGMKQQWDEGWKEAIEAGRLLVITPFEDTTRRVSKRTAAIRNKFMLELANELVVGYCNSSGELELQLKSLSKPVVHLTTA
ncbi:MAG TPA: hypothetical protein PL009_11535 [Flavipsychrobacter sp.]|nr:hypothetical protein [Flavipsychrobacter sp.]